MTKNNIKSEELKFTGDFFHTILGFSSKRNYSDKTFKGDKLTEITNVDTKHLKSWYIGGSIVSDTSINVPNYFFIVLDYIVHMIIKIKEKTINFIEKQINQSWTKSPFFRKRWRNFR